jgi:hypothetical protein
MSPIPIDESRKQYGMTGAGQHQPHLEITNHPFSREAANSLKRLSANYD